MNRPPAFGPDRFIATRILYGSADYERHMELVGHKYLREGFIPASRSHVADAFDSESAWYYRLSLPDAPLGMEGTFRLLEGAACALPTLAACAHHAVAGIHERLCESTRVVSARDRNFYGAASPPSRYVLFEAVVRALAHVKGRGLVAVISLGSPQIFEWINATFAGSQRALGVPFLYQGGMVVPSIIWLDEFERRVHAHAAALVPHFEAACREHDAL